MLKGIKDFFGLILFIIIIIITTVQGMFMYGGYEPTGEIYVKTSPSSGDAGVTDVIDFELEKEEYDINDEIVATIGFGNLRVESDAQIGVIDYPCNSFDLLIEYKNNPYDENVISSQLIHFDDNYYSNKYSTYSEKSYLDFLGHYWYWYPDFYPNFKTNVVLDIPTIETPCYIVISINVNFNYEDGEFQHKVMGLVVKYKVLDDHIIFVTENY